MIKFSRSVIVSVEEEDLRKQLLQHYVYDTYDENDEYAKVLIEEIKTLPAIQLVERFFFSDWDEEDLFFNWDFDFDYEDNFEEI